MLNRRNLLVAASGAAALSFPVFAFGQSKATDKRLLVVILRGGLDGLSAVAPVGDPSYAAARGRLALSLGGANAALPLDDTFALNPRLPKMHALYRAGELLPVHACATPYRERSHFDAQNVLESGAAAPFARTEGWLNKNPTVGISEAALEGVGLFPNPTTGVLRLSTSYTAAHTIEVMDLLGARVMTERINGNGTIDLTGMAKGVYLVRVSNNQGSLVQRVTLD